MQSGYYCTCWPDPILLGNYDSRSLVCQLDKKPQSHLSMNLLIFINLKGTNLSVLFTLGKVQLQPRPANKRKEKQGQTVHMLQLFWIYIPLARLYIYIFI